ncbi:MAG: hypothetical protein JEY99_15505 [Spirochaetales bacterium]|nr:hypothetical protein [Spirochaetales bacterium]
MSSKKRFLLFVLFLIVVSLVACKDDPFNNSESFDIGGDIDGDGILNGDDTDIDGDGLSNTLESGTYHTSPYIADTDGDGWDDYEEAVTLYDPDSYPVKFSPLVADLPRIALNIAGQLSFEMNYEYSDTHTDSSESSISREISMTSTNSNSYTETIESELGWSVEGSATVSIGTKISSEFSISAGANGSYSTSDSNSWTEEQSIANSQTSQQVTAQSNSSTISTSGGTMDMVVTFTNNSPIAFTASNLEINVYAYSLFNDEFIDSIGTLSSGATVELSPGSTSAAISFSNENLTVEKIQKLLRNSSGVMFALSSYSIDMDDGPSFTTASTTSEARCATVLIDYGPGVDKESESYLVATKTEFNSDYTSVNDQFNPISVSTVLEILGTDFTTGTTGSYTGVQSINGIEQYLDNNANAYWYIVIYSNSDQVRTYYSIKERSYDLSEIKISSGDRVEIFYSEDSDGDGLPLRIETELGSSDGAIDSDGDNLSDYEEVVTSRTSPVLKDTDNDGLNDDVDEAPFTPAVSNNSGLNSFTISAGTIYSYSDVIPGRVVTIPYDLITITPNTEVNVSNITYTHTYTYNNSDTNNLNVVPYDFTDFSSITLFPGENTFNFTVTATDDETIENYSLTVTTITPPLESFSISTPDDAYTSLLLGIEPPDENQRWNGVLVVRSTSNPVNLNSVYPIAEKLEDKTSIGGYPVVFSEIIDNENPLVSSFVDDFELTHNTTYFYDAYLFYVDGVNYYLSEPKSATRATEILPPASFHVQAMGLLCTNETEYGDSDISYSIQLLTNVNPNWVVVSTMTHDTAEALTQLNPGDPGAPYWSNDELELEAGDAAFFYNAIIPGFPQYGYINHIKLVNTTKTEQITDLSECNITTENNGHLAKTFQLPRVAGSYFVLEFTFHEWGASTTEATISKNIRFDYQTPDDSWTVSQDPATSSGFSYLSTKGSASNIYRDNTTIKENGTYTLNPYFTENSNADDSEFDIQAFVNINLY